MTHNPYVDITKDTTTLTPRRDVFLFLVDDTHPIEADAWRTDRRICIPGFYCWNSEVGSRPSGSPLFTSGVCMNRNLWGVENFEEITIRHSKFAASVLLTRRRRRSRVSPFLARPLSPGSRQRGAIVARSDRTARLSAQARFSPNRRRRRSSDRVERRTSQAREHSSILCRASRRLPDQTHQDTRSNWRGSQEAVERAA